MHIRLSTNKKTRFTRLCMGEAVLKLLEKTPFEKLRVSAIVKKAGVARMTFYKYYETPADTLKDYISLLIEEYIENSSGDTEEVYMSYEHILYSLKFFDRYRDAFLLMHKRGLYFLLIDSVNQFMLDNIQTKNALSIYELYAYAGGLLNTFLQWEKEYTDTAEDVARKIYELFGR